MTAHDDLRRRMVRLDLRAHFLQSRSKGVNLLLLTCNSRLEVFALLFDFAVLFEKLVEQHRIHRFVANGVNLAALITPSGFAEIVSDGLPLLHGVRLLLIVQGRGHCGFAQFKLRAHFV